MDPYNNRLCIGSSESGERLALAQELLESGNGSVVLDHVLILQSLGSHISVAVLTKPSMRDFAVQVQFAKSLLAASTLSGACTKRNLQWEVVDETGSVLLWHAS